MHKKPDIKKIKNIFGEIEVNLNNKIYFPEGIIGFSSKTNFCLAELSKNNPFKILQCLEDEQVTFLVLPILSPLLNNSQETYHIYELADIDLMQKELNLDAKDTIILLIVNVKQGTESKNDYFVNSRGPLVIDLKNKKGIQYVFNHNRYPFQYHLEIPIKSLSC